MEAAAVAGLWTEVPEAERGGVDTLAPAAWAARLTTLCAEARAAWPGIALDDESFARHLVARVPLAALAAAPPAELHLGELYLACACARGEPAAIAAFDKSCVAGLLQQMTAIGIPADVAGEAEQRARVRLLVAADGKTPRIADYRGRGELRAWTRTAAVREALQLLRAAKRQLPAAGRGVDDALVAHDPELAHLQTAYEAGFKQAFLEAFAQLSARERNILRQHLAFGMSCDQIAAVYSVHATTALRWSDKAREKLWKLTRRAVQERFALGAGDAESLMRALQERLHVTWERLLSERE